MTGGEYHPTWQLYLAISLQSRCLRWYCACMRLCRFALSWMMRIPYLYVYIDIFVMWTILLIIFLQISMFLVHIHPTDNMERALYRMLWHSFQYFLRALYLSLFYEINTTLYWAGKHCSVTIFNSLKISYHSLNPRHVKCIFLGSKYSWMIECITWIREIPLMLINHTQCHAS